MSHEPLSNDQRLLLQMYIHFYNQTTQQMDTLYDLQHEIIENIQSLVTSRRRATMPRRTMFRENVPVYVASGVQGTPPVDTLLRSFYDNVPVVATREQQRAATLSTTFSRIVEPLNNRCPITLERFEPNSQVMQLTRCNHIFSPTAIQSWLQNNVRCPVCRHDIRSSRSNEETKEEETLEESKEDNSPPNVPNIVSSLTQDLLNQILGGSHVFDISHNSVLFDSSSNQLIFEGYMRR